MAESESGQEKSHEPTPKRLDEARRKGQVPRSRELSTTMVLLCGASALLILGHFFVTGIASLFGSGLQIDRNLLFNDNLALQSFAGHLLKALWLVGAFAAVTVVAALLAPLSVGGWAFSPDKIKLDPTKLDPVAGLKRVFGWQGLMELLKALLKFIVVAACAALFLTLILPDLLRLNFLGVEAAMGRGLRLLAWAFFIFSASLILIAFVDTPFQVWQHKRQLRMTLQEIKDEMKDSEGRPEVKARRREVHRQLAAQRSLAAVAEADVLIMNPSHFAVALRYRESDGAPRLIGKGRDYLALQMRERALAMEVPVVELPPLARAIYFSTKIEQMIPAGLYLAVAQVLAYVHQLQRSRALRVLAYVHQLQRSRALRLPEPRQPDAVSIPEHLRRDWPPDPDDEADIDAE